LRHVNKEQAIEDIHSHDEFTDKDKIGTDGPMVSNDIKEQVNITEYPLQHNARTSEDINESKKSGQRTDGGTIRPEEGMSSSNERRIDSVEPSNSSQGMTIL
jgi:hypothetical protein